MSETLKELNRAKKKKKMLDYEWYKINSILGYSWAIFYFLVGGREAGKSYAVTNYFVNQFIKYGRPFYWVRLTDASQSKLLSNNAEKLVDPDLRRKYKLDLITKGDKVYNITERTEEGKVKKKVLMCHVLALSTFYNDKGSGLYDKDFLNDPNMYYNICFDEMNREKSEKKTFDIVYAFVNQMENIARSTKQRIRIICIGNLLEEASDMLTCLNFLPETFGRFKLKSRRAVIEYIEPTESYKKRRKGTIADLLTPNESTFTNQIKADTALIYKGRLKKPTYLIKFSKEQSDWFTIWDGKVVAQYNKEKITVIAMQPYIDELFNAKTRNSIIEIFDARGFVYKNLVTFKLFQKNLELLRPKR